jgi:hypothetical protein
MTIDPKSLQSYQSLLDSSQPVIKSKIEDAASFAETLKAQIAAVATSSTASLEKASMQSDADAAKQAFLDDLTSKGALAFYQDYNFEKIEKMIEEKKAELTDQLGLSDTAQPPLTGDARQEALSNLEDMLDAFRKQLQEKMQAKDQLDKQNTILSTFLQELA